MSEQKEKPPSSFFEQIPDSVKGLKRVALDHAMKSMTPAEVQAIGRRILENDLSKDEYRERQKDNILWLIVGVILMWVAQVYPLILQGMGLL